MIANYLDIPAFSRHRQCANLRALAHAAKQLEFVTFGSLVCVPQPGCPAKNNPPARSVRFTNLFVGGERFRGRLNLHQECTWKGAALVVVCVAAFQHDRPESAPPRSDLEGFAPLVERNSPDRLSPLPASTSPIQFRRHCLRSRQPVARGGEIFAFLSPFRSHLPVARQSVHPVHDRKVTAIVRWRLLTDWLY